MKFPFGKPIIGNEEKGAVLDVLSNPILVHGPKADQFEEDFKSFTGSPNAISVSSCTAGMHLTYLALGLNPGDEVIVPSQTHVATAHAVELVGCKAVFVDVDLTTGNVKPENILNAINKNTKAIAVVHYLGVPVDMDPIVDIANKYNLFLLEDCALAPGAKYKEKHVGLIGDVGVFSFYPIKHITSAEGGMIILKDKKLADKLRLLRAFGINRNYGERKVPGLYDSVDLGLNYRMSEIHAAIGIEQLKKLPLFLEKRKENFQKLESLLIKSDLLRVMPQAIDDIYTSVHYCLGMILDPKVKGKRLEIMNQLKDMGIGTSIYYPIPLPRMTYYKRKYGFNKESCFNANIISESIIALPVGPHLNITDMEYIGSSVIEVLGNAKN